MKLQSICWGGVAVALLWLAGSPLRAQTMQAVYAPLLGTWKGALTYRDYSNDKRVTLPTTLEVTLTTDTKTLRLHYQYDDGPGKQVEETETVAIDAAKNTYEIRPADGTTRIYAVSGLKAWAQKGGGTLVLTGTGEDNNKKADIRNTLTRSGNTLTILHEARLPGEAYRFRNQYQFTRTEKATPTVTLLTAKQLQADFVVLEKAYKQLHPGLYRYNSPAEMEAHFQTLKQQLQRNQSVSQAYLAIAVFLTKIKCGHSYPNFYNQPPSVMREVLVRPRIPFYFRWVGRKMIVTRSFASDPRLVPGTEVLALNGVPAAQIVEGLLRVSRADGANDAKRVSNMEVRGEDKYEAFDVYFPLLFPFQNEQFVVQAKPPHAAAAIKLTLPAMTHEQRLAVQKQDDARRATGDTMGWEFRFLADGQAAYLRMPTWALFNTKWDWKKFLDQCFAQMAERKTENLIVDLRGNEGGLSVGNHLVGKLISRDLPLRQFQRWVRYRTVPADLVPYLDTWDFSFKDWSKDIQNTNTGDFFRMTRFDDGPDGDVIPAFPQPFRGSTYVLVDAANSSATFEFAQIVQQNRLATLVGQPTGGNQRGINGGAFFFLTLPNSKIETDLPLVGIFPPAFRPANRLSEIALPNAGLTPDILVTPRIEDIEKGVDTELAVVLKLVKSRSPQTVKRANVAPK